MDIEGGVMIAPSRKRLGEDHPIIAYMSTMTHLSDDEIRSIIEVIKIKEYKKGTLLLKEGEVTNKCYMTLKGCVRSYYIEDGIEHTTAFYTEGDSISSTLSNVNQKPSRHYLECIEDTTLSEMTVEGEKKLYHQHPRFETMCRVQVEKDFGTYQEEHTRLMNASPEDRYKHLLESRPGLVQRVPQYQLASLIGIKPESLSRIRKRISRKA